MNTIDYYDYFNAIHDMKISLFVNFYNLQTIFEKILFDK